MSPLPSEPPTGWAAPKPDPTPTPRPARGSRWWGIFGGVAVALAVALLGWWTLRVGTDRITATTVAYQVIDDTSVRIGFDVSRPPRLPVTCTLRAIDGHFGVVGSADVVIAPTADQTTHHVATVRTVARAVTGVVQDCVRT